MSLSVTFWGTRGSRPTPTTKTHHTHQFGGNTSCVAVRTPDNNLIILDSGTGIIELGHSLAEEQVDVLLLVTHTHWDHIQGLPFFEPLHREGSALDIRGPASTRASLEDALRTQMSQDFFPLEFNDCRARVQVSEVTTGTPFEWRGVTITPQALHHPAPTLGYRLEADGSSLVYATDSELRPLFEEAEAQGDSPRLTAMMRWIEDTDLLIHDTQYSDEEYDQRRGWGHSSLSDVLRLKSQAAARSLALWHHDPAHSDADIENVVATKLGGESTVFAAEEGATIEIGTSAPDQRHMPATSSTITT